MRNFRSILLVFDKEDDATAALEWVLPLTRGSQTRLTVVEVIDQVPCGVRTSKKMTDPRVHRGSHQPGVECGEKHLAQSMEILRAQGSRSRQPSLGRNPLLGDHSTSPARQA